MMMMMMMMMMMAAAAASAGEKPDFNWNWVLRRYAAAHCPLDALPEHALLVLFATLSFEREGGGE